VLLLLPVRELLRSIVVMQWRVGPCRLPRLGLLLAVAGLVGALTAGPAVGDSRLDDIRKKQTENTSEITAAENEVVALRNQRQDLQNSVTQLASDLDVAGQHLSDVQADIDRLGAEAIVLNSQIQVTQKKLDQARAATRQSAVLLYQRRSDSGTVLQLIGSAGGSGAFIEGRQYLQHISDKRHRDAERVNALRTDLTDQQTQLADTQHQAEVARDEAVAEQTRIQNLQAQQQQTLSQISATEGTYNSKLQSLEDEKGQLAAEFKAVSDQIAAELARASQTAPLGNGRFIRPIAGAPITSGFGYRTDPITGQTAFHSGIDFGAACGTPIHAAGTGVVLSAGPNGGYGNATVLNHGGGFGTLYGHQSAIAVSVGQHVDQGQVIGYVGSTGKSTGCHLHFEVRINGNPVNPLGYL
jgi:murein DD-endopeptidase MepM/ murein hydrolase activator NlpD